jgi:hypothetical protein
MLAAKFYDVALHSTVGEAMRAARVHASATSAPELWGSLVLIGNPWHKLSGIEDKDDAATKLLRVASDSSKTSKARGAAIKGAKAALKRDPAHLRLAAAIPWAEEARKLFEERDSPISAEWAGKMADIASDLGTSAGELLFRTTEFDLESAEGAGDSARRSLDRAIDLGERLALSDSTWTQAIHALLAKRQTSDLSVEIPEIRLSSGMVINDRSDPAVRAFFEVQHAVDQREVRTAAALRLHLPDRSLDELAWNAIVLGSRSRFPG